VNLPKCLQSASLWKTKSAKDWGQSAMTFSDNTKKSVVANFATTGEEIFSNE
jgi:hypothetical protein